MVISSIENFEATIHQTSSYEKMSKLNALNDTQHDLEGLVDAGITKIAQIIPWIQVKHTSFFVCLTDLESIDKIETIKHKEMWTNFLKTVNHDIPIFFLDEMLQGDQKIYKKDINFNKQYYIRDIVKKKIVHARTFNLEILMDYSKHLMKFGGCFLRLLSECLCLDPFPHPKLTIDTNKHSDYEFLTLPLQDHTIGLQVLHQNQWVDVPPTRGALGVKIGYLLRASFIFIF
uniref:Isopenicillin N synthase-like Fe(2+) 2OG dioxygenase domain-containing protein n=1 Tax=Solanum lycopersicum TaxID=4081 RepID=A0A3Q7EBU2_SOLLC